MTWYRTANQYVIFVREYFTTFQAFQFNPVIAHTASHSHTFEYPGRIRRTTN